MTHDSPPDARPPGRILVIRGGAIGDFILTLPALAALKSTFPAAHIEVMTYPRVAGLALEFGHAHRAHSIETRALAGFFGRDTDLDFELSRTFSECSVIVSYLYDPDQLFRTNIARISKAQLIQGTHKPDDADPRHAAVQLLDPLRHLAIFDASPVPNLRTLPPPPRTIPPTLVAHPGSGSRTKNWSTDFWLELFREIDRRRSHRILLVGGEAEGPLLAQITSQLPRDRVEIAQNTPLPTLARRLASTQGFVGHDSGISHLAAAVGLPGIALWKHTNPVVWRPHSERFEIIREIDPPALANRLCQFV